MTQSVDPYRRARRWVFALTMVLLLVLLVVATYFGWPLLERAKDWFW